MEGAVTLKSACKEVLRRGFKTIWIPVAGIHDNLLEFTDDLEESGEEAFALFGAMILRLTDAWKEDAEVYELDY